MNDGNYYVDILDEQGNVVTKKLRKDIIKGKDIYHAVYIVLITPSGDVAISKIANRTDMPNLHAGKLGCTAATVKRTDETGDQAAQRAVTNELGINTTPKLFYEDIESVDNTYRKVGYYTVETEVPTAFSKADIDEIITMSKDEFSALIAEHPEQITPLLKQFWGRYRKVAV